MVTNTTLGKYVVYVDESGDHGLETIDPEYPIFVLAFCIFEKAEYAKSVVSSLTAFKLEHFGHDQVVLHERDIRKAKKPFQFLQESAEVRETFYASLGEVLDAAPMRIIAAVIDKKRLASKHPAARNPYEIALAFGLERVTMFLNKRSNGKKLVYVVCESRGKREDDELELEFRRICDGANYRSKSLPLRVQFASKQVNSSGLQLADLCARPIGRHVMNPAQPNRAWDTIKKKLDCDGQGRYEGYGLKIFP